MFPDWFDQTPFKSKDFNVDEWVETMHSRGHTMEELQVQLDAYGKVVEGKLVEITARDFDKFLALSDELPDIEGAMKDWDAPLDKLIAQITAQRDAMQKELDEMEGALKEKKRLADERETLELMLETHNVVAKVERLLHEVGAGPAGKESATDPETAVDDSLGVADVLDDDDDSDDVPEDVAEEDEDGLAPSTRSRPTRRRPPTSSTTARRCWSAWRRRWADSGSCKTRGRSFRSCSPSRQGSTRARLRSAPPPRRRWRRR